MSDLITTSDIAPNAGILGTQIADKTIELRNLNSDVFYILSEGVHTVTKSANSQAQTDFIDISSLGLLDAPLVLGTVTDGGFFYALPFNIIDESGITNGGRVSATLRVAAADADTLFCEIRTPNYTGNGLYTSQVVKEFRYYILQQSANPVS